MMLWSTLEESWLSCTYLLDSPYFNLVAVLLKIFCDLLKRVMCLKLFKFLLSFPGFCYLLLFILIIFQLYFLGYHEFFLIVNLLVFPSHGSPSHSLYSVMSSLVPTVLDIGFRCVFNQWRWTCKEGYIIEIEYHLLLYYIVINFKHIRHTNSVTKICYE